MPAALLGWCSCSGLSPGPVNAQQAAAEEQALAECVRRGRPFGSDTWQKRTAARLGLTHTFRDRGRPTKKKRAPAL